MHVRHGAEQRAVAVALERLDGALRQRSTLLLERLVARLQRREAEPKPQAGRQRLEDAAPRGDDLAANAVAGDEAYVSISKRDARGGYFEGNWGAGVTYSEGAGCCHCGGGGLGCVVLGEFLVVRRVACVIRRFSERRTLAGLWLAENISCKPPSSRLSTLSC